MLVGLVPNAADIENHPVLAVHHPASENDLFVAAMNLITLETFSSDNVRLVLIYGSGACITTN